MRERLVQAINHNVKYLQKIHHKNAAELNETLIKNQTLIGQNTLLTNENADLR